MQVYLKQPDATVPAPRVRLGAFERIKHLAPGASIAVKLSVPPEARAVVHGGEATGEAVYAASAGVTLEKGRLEIFVGGGQPDFFKGRLPATSSQQEEPAAGLKPMPAASSRLPRCHADTRAMARHSWAQRPGHSLGIISKPTLAHVFRARA